MTMSTRSNSTRVPPSDPAHPSDDPRVTLAREPGDGSASGEDCLIDETAEDYRHDDSAPVDRNAIELSSGINPPATRVSDLPKRQWRLHNDLGHDEYSKETVRRDAKYRRCDAILDSLEVPDWAQRHALRRVMTENLNRWSRHEGADGAVVGFVCLALFETADEAMDSTVAERASEIVPELSDLSVKKLLRYAFNEDDVDDE